VDVSALLRHQVERWGQGDCVRVEDLLAQAPALAADAVAIIDLISQEAHLRKQRDETLDPEEYCQRFPHLASQLRAELAVDQALDVRTKPVPTEQIGRYQLLEEIAEGGMGKVLRVRDPDFERTLAIKVMKPKASEHPTAQRRFLEEARLTGRLQHPGIPPVHELGRLDNGSPFFAMKLVKGHTFKALLKQRTDPTQELPRFLGIFRQVCQTVAYAHSRGIIHRDLKPHNIMVGAFGEVQVMDWGLAKAIAHLAEEEATVPVGHSSIEALHWNREAGLSRTGDVMGTPAYMAPEQARGEIRTLDQRCDVFGLGAILCEVLTGKPPFWQGSGLDLVLQAADGNLKDAFARLDNCGTAAELVELTRHCLAPHPADRPRHAGQVAEAVERYEAMVQERLRQAELERHKAQVQAEEERKRAEVEQARAEEQRRRAEAEQARAEEQRWRAEAEQSRADEERKRRAAEQAQVREERRRRRVQLGLVSTAALLALATVTAGAWFLQDWMHKNDRRAQLEDALTIRLDGLRARQRTLHAQLADPIKASQRISDMDGWQKEVADLRNGWQLALELVDKNGELLDPSWFESLRALDQTLQADHRDWQLARDLDDIRMKASTAVEGKLNSGIAVREYPSLFQKHRLAVANGQTAALVADIGRSRLRHVLVAALDDWALRIMQDDWSQKRVAKPALRAAALEPLWEVARQLDPDPWRNQVRDPKLGLAELRALAAGVKPATQTPHILHLLAVRLASHPEAEKDGVALLRRATLHHHQDFWLHILLGDLVKDPVARAGCNQAALALRPRNSGAHNNLGVALAAQKDYGGAITCYRQALQFDPTSALTYTNWGLALKEQKDYAGAIARYRQALQLDPNFVPAHMGLGLALAAQKDYAGAIRHYQKALKLDPRYAPAHKDWGNFLATQKDYAGAIAHYEKASLLDPRDAPTHYNWGNALYSRKDHPGAIAHYQKALQLDPNFAPAHTGWGRVLVVQQDYAGAIDHFRQALQLDPNTAHADFRWGMALQAQQDYAGAIHHFRQALKLDPQDAHAHLYWGTSLQAQQDYAGAVHHYKLALQLDPNLALAHANWAAGLQAQQDYAGAVRHYQLALKLNPNFALTHLNCGVALHTLQDYAGAIHHFEQALRLDPNLALAHHNWGGVLQAQKDYAGAVRHFEQALQLDPNLAHAHCALGEALLARGEFARAEQATQRGLQRLPAGHPLRAFVQKQLEQCRQALQVEQRAVALAHGQAQPAEPAELFQLAQFCRQFRRYHAGAHLFTAAFAAQPGLAEDPTKGYRGQAAGAAALAATGQGWDAGQLKAKAKAQLRRQALDWLCADRVLLSRVVTSYRDGSPASGQKPVSPLENLSGSPRELRPADLLRACDQLRRWQTDPDLASLRDEKELAKLPAEEQKACRQLWADVRALEKQARGCFSERQLTGSLTAPQKEQAQAVKLQTGKVYVFDLDSRGLDSILRLEDDQGQKLAEDKGWRPGLSPNSCISFDCPKDGTYCLVVTVAGPRTTGNYTLIIREFPGPKK
jgi:tetratricopeptide (TPR) repeat protein/tRNA A-37 threonylcarbamoyl transferase component Bud32